LSISRENRSPTTSGANTIGDFVPASTRTIISTVLLLLPCFMQAPELSCAMMPANVRPG